ncbi:MAG: hypothetical protein WC052_04320 [Patescibacteria group bacterium]
MQTALPQTIIQSTASFSAAMEERWPGSSVLLKFVTDESMCLLKIRVEMAVYSGEDCVEKNRLTPFYTSGRYETRESAVASVVISILVNTGGIDATYDSGAKTWRSPI